MNNLITFGIMQGRLSSKPGKPLQSFPINSWREEFLRASKLGFNQIEWLVDGENDKNNPIKTESGRKEMHQLASSQNISINSLCAHKYLDGSLLHNVEKILDFESTLEWANQANIKFLILPLMDAMTISENNTRVKLKQIFRNIVDSNGPCILLECDVTASEILNFLDDVALENLGVVFDIGNATALNFNVENEINILGNFIKEIHIKDRHNNGGVSTRLGCADANFSNAANALKEMEWSGPMILETPIFSNWIEEAEQNIAYAKKIFSPKFY